MASVGGGGDVEVGGEGGGLVLDGSYGGAIANNYPINLSEKI